MALWRLYYHIVWATKNRYPYITVDKESQLYSYIISKSDSLECIVHSIGGIEDHLHLIASIPPKLSIAEFVKIIKGSSSRFYNMELQNQVKFSWQDGYGIFSLGAKQLDKAINYVNNQKIHHYNNSVLSYLEKIDHNDDPPIKYNN
jgi:putative transposase